MKLVVKNILRLLLARAAQPLNVTNASTVFAAAATTEALVQTVQHTSGTGRIRIDADFPLYTSRFTSTIKMLVNDTLVQSLGTNIQPNPNMNICDRVNFKKVVDVPKNTPVSIKFYLAGQDSGTTATIPAYRQGCILIQDLKS